MALSHERPSSRAWRPELREFGKGLAASLPIRWAEGIADYAVMRSRPDLLPPEYVIRERAAYFARIATLLGGPDVPLTFLEFGVYQGDSLRRWLALNRHPDSRFLGFDSFTGLPARWRSRPAGYFDCGGQVPAITDPRVSFVPGWFNQTLPGTLTTLPPPSPARKLLVHIDADLHASALYCLVTLGAAFGSFLVMFDEYGAGEARALRDTLDAWGGSFVPMLGLKRSAASALPTRVFGLFTLAAGA